MTAERGSSWHDFATHAVSLLQVVPSSHHDSPYWTTNNGAPVFNNNQSLTAGVRGPVLLEDYHLIEKIAQVLH